MWQAFLSNAASQSSSGGSDYSQGAELGGPSSGRDSFDLSTRLSNSASLNTPINVMPVGVNLGSVMMPYQEPSANGGMGLNTGNRLSTLYDMLGVRDSQSYVYPDNTNSKTPGFLIMGLIASVIFIVLLVIFRR